MGYCLLAADIYIIIQFHKIGIGMCISRIRTLASTNMAIVELSNHIYEISSLLTSEECDVMVEVSELKGFRAADVQINNSRKLLTSVRNNERVDYYSDEFAMSLWGRLNILQLPMFNNQVAIGLSPYFRFYKYQEGQKFNMHKDGRQSIGLHKTPFTLLIYLNQNYTGGSTLFRQDSLEFLPSKGNAVLFEHHLWHQGCIIESGVKYVLRTDVIYRG